MDDADLLSAAARGDGDAFAAFYRRHDALVLGYLRRRVGEPELAFDLAAETFAAALLSARRYKAQSGPATAWLLGIAHNKLLESLRRGRVEAAARRKLRLDPIVVDDADLEAVEERAAAGAGRLTRLLAELPSDQRRAILARDRRGPRLRRDRRRARLLAAGRPPARLARAAHPTNATRGARHERLRHPRTATARRGDPASPPASARWLLVPGLAVAALAAVLFAVLGGGSRAIPGDEKEAVSTPAPVATPASPAPTRTRSSTCTRRSPTRGWSTASSRRTPRARGVASRPRDASDRLVANADGSQDGLDHVISSDGTMRQIDGSGRYRVIRGGNSDDAAKDAANVIAEEQAGFFASFQKGWRPEPRPVPNITFNGKPAYRFHVAASRSNPPRSGAGLLHRPHDPRATRAGEHSHHGLHRHGDRRPDRVSRPDGQEPRPAAQLDVQAPLRLGRGRARWRRRSIPAQRRRADRRRSPSRSAARPPPRSPPGPRDRGSAPRQRRRRPGRRAAVRA